MFPGFWWRRTRGAHRSELIMANSEVIQRPHLQRRFGLLQATALNMSNMIGIGPFMTIPLLMSTLGGGPQAMLGWVVALLIVIPDGMIWSELGAATNSLGSIVFTDTTTHLSPRKFYRARFVPERFASSATAFSLNSPSYRRPDLLICSCFLSTPGSLLHKIKQTSVPTSRLAAISTDERRLSLR